MTIAAGVAPATFAAAKAIVVAALKDPLSFIAQRSPGGRGPGTLLMTKPNRPTERVLSGVRERPPAAGAPDSFAAGDMGPTNFVPASASAPEQIFGAPSPASFTPFGAPNSFGNGFPVRYSAPAVNSIGVLPLFPTPVSQSIPDIIPPLASLPDTDTPTSSASTPTPNALPTPPGGPSVGPTVTPIPEPATWLMLSFGLLILVGGKWRPAFLSGGSGRQS